MIQLDSSQISSLSSAIGEPFSVSWDSFVQIVLDTTVEAYLQMRASGAVNTAMEEDAFSAILTEDYIRPLLRSRQSLNIVAECQAPVYTPAMKTGMTSTKYAKWIDIRVGLSAWSYERIYFAWECKLVADRRLNAAYRRLCPDYVREGVRRFMNGAYAADVSNAGMLGYVLAGDVSVIVDDINKSMDRKDLQNVLSSTDHLVPTSSIGSFADVYQSRHMRSGLGDIQLHHLFLTF